LEGPASLEQQAEIYKRQKDINRRWTEHEAPGVVNVKRIFDMLPPASVSLADMKPVPSSFSGIHR